MNSDAHANILTAAVEAQAEPLREQLTADRELLQKAGSYPDYFDNPAQPAAEKDKIDPEWRRFCAYPETLAGPSLHLWPGNILDQSRRIPLVEYLLDQMIACRKSRDMPGFVKFSGCLSHYFGDMLQSAHLNPESDPNYIRKLLPIPETSAFGGFHYHTSIEAVTGVCAPLKEPALQGTEALEAAWRLTHRCRSAIDYCSRFIVPIVQALFAGDEKRAIFAASEPVTIAAQLTADAIHTVDAIAMNHFLPDEIESSNTVDLRLQPPDEQFHDLVYSGAILDGNKNVPPYTVPITPAKLHFPDGIKFVRGLGMLPHSGMNGPRECYMTWDLPVGVFRRFSAKTGLHAELAVTGAVAFQVLLDDREVWNSGRMTGADTAREVNVALEDARRLTLKVSDANNRASFWKNHAFWADPLLLKK